ncbi:MAG: NADH-ubiquinone oxidoreductase-F iron-sulfur binding region domain-containing protein [Actinomycetota bacterium]
MSLLDGNPCLSLADYVAAGGLRGWERAAGMTPDQVIDEVSASGLRGRGGGGFSTGAKWRAIRSAGTGDRYVVANGAEGEPATFKDRFVLRHNPYLVLEGLAIAAYAVGASRAFLGLKEGFGPERAALERALQEVEEAGALGGRLEIQVVPGPDHYLLGEETGLLEVIEGRDPMPRVARPYMLGLFGTVVHENPTAVNNVETLANVARVLAEGSRWLRAAGTERSPGTMLFTVCGDVRNEGVFELPLGMPLRFLIEELAGGAREGRSIKAVVPGASAEVIPARALDVRMDFDEMSAAGSGLGAGGFAVWDDTACMVRTLLLYSRFLHVESCGQCPPCKLGTGAITTILERMESGEGRLGDLEAMLDRAPGCTDGARCALPTGETRLVQSFVTLFLDEFEQHLGGTCPRPRSLQLPKIVDFDETAGRFRYDERYHLKQPDWTWADA